MHLQQEILATPLRRRRARLAATLFQLDRSASGPPLNEQLYRQLHELILSGVFKAGTKLPSSRAISSALGLSRNSVLAALGKLEADGWIENRRGSGSFVTYQGAINIAALRAPHEGFSRPHPLARSCPLTELFPVPIWRRLQARCWKQMKDSDLHGIPSAGLPELRSAIARLLTTTRGLACQAEQVFITTNTRGAVDLAVRALALHRTGMWVENPGIFGSRQSLVHSGVQPLAVPVDGEGLQVDVGRSLFPHARAALVTPACHVPSCVSLSAARRKSLMAWAEDVQGWILEDDYAWFSHFDGSAPLPIAAESARTIFLGSFNQILFNGLKIAFAVVPPQMIDRFAAVNSGLEGQSSGPNQIVLAEFCNGGWFDQHVRDVRIALAKRREMLRAGLRRGALSEIVTLRPQSAGLHLMGDPGSMSVQEFISRSATHHVEVTAASEFWITPPSAPGIILGFGAFSPATIQSAVAALNRAFD